MKKTSALLLALVLSINALSIKAQEGWSNENGIYYYYENNTKKTGWFKDEFNCWYYLDYQTGAMKTGWVAAGDYWYYMNPANGIMQTGWLEVNGNKYYLDQSGAMYEGVKTIDGKTYNFNFNGTLLNEIQMLEGSLPAGKYVGGENLDAGEYIIYDNIEKKNGNLQRIEYKTLDYYEDRNGNEQVRENKHIKEYSDYINLKKGQEILIVKGFIIPLNKSADLEVKSSGSYVVGIHINAGNYVLSIADDVARSRIEIYDRKEEQTIELITLENNSLINPKQIEINLQEGQILNIQNCILTEK